MYQIIHQDEFQEYLIWKLHNVLSEKEKFFYREIASGEYLVVSDDMEKWTDQESIPMTEFPMTMVGGSY